MRLRTTIEQRGRHRNNQLPLPTKDKLLPVAWNERLCCHLRTSHLLLPAAPLPAFAAFFCGSHRFFLHQSLSVMSVPHPSNHDEDSEADNLNNQGAESTTHRRTSLEVSPPSPLMSTASSRSNSQDLDDNSTTDGLLQFNNQHDAATGTHSTPNENGRPSNTLLLGTAFVSFLTFSSVQMFFAFLAGSQAM